MKKLHKTIAAISWGMLAAAFIHLCFKWSSMPEITGVHFDGDGEFDVFASKKYIAYPYIVGIVFLFLLNLGSRAANKVKLGVKMNDKGEHVLRELICLLLDANCIFISGMAVYWSELVIYQHKMIELPVIVAMIVLFVMFLNICISVPVLKIIYPLRSGNGNENNLEE